MKDALDIARNAGAEAIIAGTRQDARDSASESTWLLRAQTFAFISIAGSMREIIDWASIGDDLGQPEPELHVRMTVTGGCGHVLGTYTDKIDEKYPFWCDVCEEYIRTDKYPWTITTELVPGEPAAEPPKAEPLVMCGKPDGDGKPCVLLPDHEGGCAPYFATGPSWRDEATGLTSGPLPEFQP